MKTLHHPLFDFIRPGSHMTPLCAGCGGGIIAQGILRAILRLGLDIDNVVFVSGVDCAGSIPSPLFNADVIQTPMGRSVAVATGVKLHRPHLKVVVVGGDGDLMALGGNHLLHAARRKLDMTVICVNNGIYETTGGQTTPGHPSEIPTYGDPPPPFDLCALTLAAGAAYVARWTVYHARELSQSVEKALTRSGLSFIETVSNCCKHIVPRIGINNAAEMMEIYKGHSISVEEANALDPTQYVDKWVVGEFAPMPGTRQTTAS